jgi:hypothetical protein
MVVCGDGGGGGGGGVMTSSVAETSTTDMRAPLNRGVEVVGGEHSRTRTRCIGEDFLIFLRKFLSQF